MNARRLAIARCEGGQLHSLVSSGFGVNVNLTLDAGERAAIVSPPCRPGGGFYVLLLPYTSPPPTCMSSEMTMDLGSVSVCD